MDQKASGLWTKFSFFPASRDSFSMEKIDRAVNSLKSNENMATIRKRFMPDKVNW